MNEKTPPRELSEVKKNTVFAVMAVLVMAFVAGPFSSVSPRASAGVVTPEPAGDVGSGWIPDVVLAGSGQDYTPEITTANNGDLLIVYEEGPVSNRDIYFSRSTDGGATWIAPVAVASTAADEHYPDITTDVFTNRIFVSYQVDGTGIYVSYSDDGIIWQGGSIGFFCTTACDRPRIAAEYWNGGGNKIYLVVSAQITANDWNWVLFRSDDHGAGWDYIYESGISTTDYRANPEIAVQHGADLVDRVYVTYRTGTSFPGNAGCIDWSTDNGTTFLGPACNMSNVATPIPMAASHDGLTFMRVYGAVSPVDDIVWVIDDTDPSGFTAWGWWPGGGYYPEISVDGEGQADTALGGYYHVMARDTGGMMIIYASAPVTMTSNVDWSSIATISDSAADASDSYTKNSITTQNRGGVWYPVAAWCDYRYFQWDIRTTTPGSQWTFETIPAGLDVIVDGVTLTTSVTLTFVAGTTHAVDVVTPQPGMGPGERYAWVSWDDGGNQAHTIPAGTTDTTLTATFGTEYEVAFDTMPTGLDVTFDGMTNTAPTTFWGLAGLHTVSVPSPQPGAAGTRYVWASWSDTGGLTHDIDVTAPMALSATFDTEYEVTIDSTPTGRTVTFDGVAGTTPASYWVLQGTYTMSTTSPQLGATGWRYTFSSWSDAGTLSHDVDISGPTSFSVTFSTSVLLTVDSAQGNVDGGGWYDLGDNAVLHANSPVAGGTGTRYVFSSWSGDATGTNNDVQVLMDAPKTVTANWETQYWLNVTTAHGTVTGTGWYPAGDTAYANVTTTEPTDGGKTWQFTGWSGDATGTATSVTVTMNAPKLVTAHWREKPGIFGTGATDMIVFSIIIVVIIVVVLLVILLMRRKKRKQQQQPAQMPPPPPPQMAPPGQPPQWQQPPQQAPPPPQQWPPQQPPQRPP